jgi:hypothetical protein
LSDDSPAPAGVRLPKLRLLPFWAAGLTACGCVEVYIIGMGMKVHLYLDKITKGQRQLLEDSEEKHRHVLHIKITTKEQLLRSDK